VTHVEDGGASSAADAVADPASGGGWRRDAGTGGGEPSSSHSNSEASSNGRRPGLGEAVPASRVETPGAGDGTSAPAVPAAAVPATGRAWPRRLRTGWTSGLVCAAAMLAVGPLLGLLWASTAPRLDVSMVVAGSSAELVVQSGIDAYFGFICAVAGAIGGVIAFWRAADAGWPVPAGLAIGGFGGSLLAGWVGHRMRSPGLLDALPPDVAPILVDLVDMRVRAAGLYLVYPTTALAVLALLIWITSVRPAPAGHADPERERSSDR
jgi:hypothetical protein